MKKVNGKKAVSAKTPSPKPTTRNHAPRLSLEEKNAAEDARCHKYDAENAERLKQITRIRYLRNYQQFAGCGIGFVNFGTPNEKLVEYSFNGLDPLEMTPISIAESVEWVRKILYSELRFANAKLGDLSQTKDAGEQRWLQLVFEKCSERGMKEVRNEKAKQQLSPRPASSC